MEHRLVGWQSAPSGGSVTPSTDSYLYDGAERRVEQDAVAQLTCPPEAPTQGSCGSVTTDTVYLSGDAEEIASNGSVVTSTTKNYSAGGLLLGTLIASGGTESLHVLASDGLGSVTVALSTSGTATASALYSPYGTVRYASGQMPTAHGYTGQVADAMTGLDDYGARYYDPNLGEFTSADTQIEGGLDRYAYVGDSPCTYNDPSGHCAQKRPNGSLLGKLKRIVAWVALAITLARGRHDLAPPAKYSGTARNGGGQNEQTIQGEPARPIAAGSGGSCGGDDGSGKGGGTRTIAVGGVDTAPEGEEGTQGTSGTEETSGGGHGSNAGDAGEQTTNQGGGTSSYASIVPGNGLERWMSYEAQQDREAQLAQIQNARTVRLESLSPPSYSDYSLPGGVYVSAGCSQDPSCVSASMNEAEQNLQNPARAHPPLVGATSHVVPLAVPEWVEVAVELAEAA